MCCNEVFFTCLALLRKGEFHQLINEHPGGDLEGGRERKGRSEKESESERGRKREGEKVRERDHE